MSEQGGPYPPSGQGQTGTGAAGPGTEPGQRTTRASGRWAGNQGGLPAGSPHRDPQGWQQPGQPPTGPQGWQQPGSPTGPQGWQPGPASPPDRRAGSSRDSPPAQQGVAATGPTDARASRRPGRTRPAVDRASSPPSPPPAKNRTPLIITAIAVVVALVAAAGIYFFAIRDTNDVAPTGGQSPQESVTALFTTLSNSDPIGLADQLDPAEATLFTDLNTDIITELKRLEVLSPAASADSMTGTTITSPA